MIVWMLWLLLLCMSFTVALVIVIVYVDHDVLLKSVRVYLFMKKYIYSHFACTHNEGHFWPLCCAYDYFDKTEFPIICLGLWYGFRTYIKFVTHPSFLSRRSWVFIWDSQSLSARKMPAVRWYESLHNLCAHPWEINCLEQDKGCSSICACLYSSLGEWCSFQH